MINKLERTLKDVFFPLKITCDLCGADTFDGTNFCPDCRKRIHFNNGVTCPVCGRKTVRPEICLECKQKPPLFKKAVSPLVFEDGSEELIWKFKNGYGYLADYFSEIIAEKLIGFPAIDRIIYVPSTKNSRKLRGFNQSKLIAKKLSKRVSTPLVNEAVIKVKKTKMQKSLTRKEREENLKGSFKVAKRDEVKGMRVLLVDDVLTTGATADEITKVLLSAGATAVYVATVCSVEYKTLPTQ